MVEVAIGLSLVGVFAIKASMVMNSASDLSQREPTVMSLNSQASQVVDRIALAILGSERETLIPQFQAPIHTGSLRCKVSLGVEDGEVVWDDPVEIGLNLGQQVLWRKNPDEPGESRVVWTNLARPLLEGEILNGVDDNGNGLIDETGLTFVLEGDAVTIRLSLGRQVGEGEFVTQTVETTVTIRNRSE